MSRVTASERARRMLAIIPWIVEQGEPRIAEVCRRFAVSEQELRADFDALQYVGTYPRTWDVLNEVIFIRDRVKVIPGPYFRRPLKLTAAQTISVLAAAKATASLPGADANGPLQRALAKLESTVVGGSGGAVEVELGAAKSEVLDALQTGIGESRRVEIDYYSAHRDSRSSRKIDPYRLSHHDGAWSVTAWCHTAGDVRRFRVDRIASAEVLDEQFTPPTTIDRSEGYRPSVDAPRVTLRLDPSAAWVGETFPSDSVEIDEDGGSLVQLAVESEVWFARLMMGLGSHATIVSVECHAGAQDPAGVEADIRRLAPDAARAVLARYT